MFDPRIALVQVRKKYASLEKTAVSPAWIASRVASGAGNIIAHEGQHGASNVIAAAMARNATGRKALVTAEKNLNKTRLRMPEAELEALNEVALGINPYGKIESAKKKRWALDSALEAAEGNASPHPSAPYNFK